MTLSQNSTNDDPNGEGVAVPIATATSSTADVAAADEVTPGAIGADGSDCDGAGGAPPPRWVRFVAYGLLPGLALSMAVGAGYLKWIEASAGAVERARTVATQAAKDGTIAILSYKAATVDKDLDTARDRLTGPFKDAYTRLTHDVVIPGSQQQQITAVAGVPGIAAVSATDNHAVVLVFVNQRTVIGSGPPTDATSTVRVTLDRVGDQWLISGFDPI